MQKDAKRAEPTRRDVLAGAGAAMALALAPGANAQSLGPGPLAGDRVILTNEDSCTLSVIDPTVDRTLTTINLTSFDEDPRPPFRFVTGGMVPSHGAMLQKPLYHGAISIHGASPTTSFAATCYARMSRVKDQAYASSSTSPVRHASDAIPDAFQRPRRHRPMPVRGRAVRDGVPRVLGLARSQPRQPACAWRRVRDLHRHLAQALPHHGRGKRHQPLQGGGDGRGAQLLSALRHAYAGELLVPLKRYHGVFCKRSKKKRRVS